MNYIRFFWAVTFILVSFHATGRAQNEKVIKLHLTCPDGAPVVISQGNNKLWFDPTGLAQRNPVHLSSTINGKVEFHYEGWMKSVTGIHLNGYMKSYCPAWFAKQSKLDAKLRVAELIISKDQLLSGLIWQLTPRKKN